MATSLKETAASRPLQKAVKAASERALDYVEQASRVRLKDVLNNPGARTARSRVTTAMNQCGHTIGELQHAAKPPLGWVWGDFYKPWQRMFPGDRNFNGDINVRREYVPLSLIELQRLIDLNWLDTTRLIDICALCATRQLKVDPKLRQFGIHLTDEGDDVFSASIDVEVQWASLNTIAAIERAGGRIRTAYYDLESLKAAVDPEKWFLSGRPIPRRKYPPHSLMNYYSDPIYRGYLAEQEGIKVAQLKLAEILGYSLLRPAASDNHLNSQPTHSRRCSAELKRPDQVFMGLEPGQLVSLADKKVLEPTHPELISYYRLDEPLSDNLL